MSALAGLMRTLSFRLVWDSPVVRQQQAVVASSRYAKLIDKGTRTTDWQLREWVGRMEKKGE
jgi:hypothetical protein